MRRSNVACCTTVPEMMEAPGPSTSPAGASLFFAPSQLAVSLLGAALTPCASAGSARVGAAPEFRRPPGLGHVPSGGVARR
jgi:hypothetical protein